MPQYHTPGNVTVPPYLMSSLRVLEPTLFKKKKSSRARLQVSNTNTLYARPRGQETFDAIATIISPGKKMKVMLLQMTISASHTFNEKGILEAMHAFGEDVVGESCNVKPIRAKDLKHEYDGFFVASRAAKAESLVRPFTKTDGVKLGRGGYQLPIGYLVVPIDSPLHPINMCSVVEGPFSPPISIRGSSNPATNTPSSTSVTSSSIGHG